MDTPICDYVKKYSESYYSRLHMPGHKGKNMIGPENIDITEIEGADALFHADGIIKKSEENASLLFKSGATFYSTYGSTHCIASMVTIAQNVAKSDGVSELTCKKIIALRNVHKAFINNCAMLDLDVEWIFPDKNNDSICQCNVSVERIEEVLKSTDAFALYITSPDYLGNVADIQTISKLCHDNGKLLLVDNAHGAYLAFLKESLHPIALGADMCNDSAHKTLPVLTGGAYLHLSKEIAGKCSNVKDIMSLYASTSPSYVIMQSLDMCNKYLEESFRNDIIKTGKKVKELEDYIRNLGFETIGNEDLKITVYTGKSGIDGNTFADVLREHKAECEFSDNNFVVLMFSPFNDDIDYIRVKNAADSIKATIKHEEILVKKESAQSIFVPKKVMTIRQAVFSPSRKVNVDEAAGKICGMTVVSCPPAIPVVVSGELINEKMIPLFKNNGIENINIVDCED